MACKSCGFQLFRRLTSGVTSPRGGQGTGIAALSTTSRKDKDRSYKLLIVGGGAGGTAMANTFTPTLGKGQVAIVEPSPNHYYQPMFTLVASGLKRFEQTVSFTKDHLPDGVDWLQDKVATFDPDKCTVTTENGDVVKYEYMVVALGVQLDYHKIKGLPEALESDPRVCSNYSPKYVKKTLPAIENFKEGNAIFTFPNAPIKCAGAPQKICYLTEELFRKQGKRDKANILYNTALGVLFGVPKYAEPLWKVVKARNIQVNLKTSLIEVHPDKSQAVFELLDSEGKTETYDYSMLHVSPPCSASKPLSGSKLVDATNFVDVDRETLQHKKYQNVFGIGDCTNAPTAKTAAAVAAQSGVVGKNLALVMEGKQVEKKYNGYTSCPLIVSSSECIMAEFGYDGQILETFPINQAVPRRTMYHLKADIMPHMYWHGLIKGRWHGPGVFRKVIRFGRV